MGIQKSKERFNVRNLKSKRSVELDRTRIAGWSVDVYVARMYLRIFHRPAPCNQEFGVQSLLLSWLPGVDNSPSRDHGPAAVVDEASNEGRWTGSTAGGVKICDRGRRG